MSLTRLHTWRTPLLVRTRPFNPILDRRLDQLTSSLFTTTARRSPAVGATWQDGSLVLTVDLPGTPFDAVGISVAGRTLTLSTKTDDLTWERSVRLGAPLDPEQVSATYLDGRLTVTVAAAAVAEARQIDISTTPAAAIDVEVTQPANGTSDTV